MRRIFVASLLMMLCLMLLVARAQGSNPETWPTVYQDNFDDPTSGWAVEETEQAAKGYVDGTYEIAIKNADKWAYSPVPGMDFLDFTLDVNVRVQTGSSGYFAFIYRHADWNNYYIFAVSASESCTLRMRRDGNRSTLENWTGLKGTFNEKETDHIRLVAQGSTVSFFLNGKLVLEETDDAFQGGEIYLAVGAFTESSGLAVRFDNLVIRADPTAQQLLNRARDLYTQARESYERWETMKALDLFQRSLALYKQLNWKRKQAKLAEWVGRCQYRLSAYAEAITSYEKALLFYRDTGSQRDEVTTLGNIGSCYLAQGNFREALDYYGQAIAIARDIHDRNNETYCLIGFGACYASLDDYKKAIDYYQQALAIAREIRDRDWEAYSLKDLGRCYFSLGDYERATDYLEQSLAIFREIGDRNGEAWSLKSLGDGYFFVGDYKKAIDYLEQSLVIFREIGDRDGEAWSLKGLGGGYLFMGDYKRATDYLEQSLAIFREIDDRNGEANGLNDLGECYRMLGEIDRAVDCYEQALAINQATGYLVGKAIALDNLGNCYREKKQYQRALDYYARSQEILQAIGWRYGQAEGLDDLAECYLDKGDYQQAIDHYQQALAIAAEIGTVGTKWKGQWGLGKAYWKQGELTQAKVYYEQAITTVEGVRSRIKVEKLEQSYTASVRNLYEEYIELLLEMGEGKNTLSADERARARAFLDALTASPAGISKKTIEAGIANGIDSAAIKDAVQTVVEESPRESAILEYLVTNQGTLVWIIRGGEQHGPYKIPHGRKELTDKVIECRQQIEQLKPIANLDLAILYDWLIRPIESLLPPSDANHYPHLIIVPSGPLYYLPFQALIWTSPDRSEHSYFIERYALSYSPSLTMIKYEQLPEEQSASKSMFVALANPNPDPSSQKMRLPEAEKEAYRVAACFPVANVYVGEDANEDVLGTVALGAQSILFAAHGMFDPNNPMYSYIALSPTDNTDGRLYAYEVFNLSLDTDTVVLSACETLLPAVKNLNQQMTNVAARTGTQPSGVTTNQLVTITAGDDIVGLTRAFLIAGASSVISSLWNVDSKAAGQLMISFYHHFEDNKMTKAEALRAASLDIMNNSDWNLPCYWAPFELFGGWQ